MTFLALAWRFRIPIAALCAILALTTWLYWHDRQVIAQDRLEATVEAQRIDAIADDVAGQIAASEAATIEQENDDARKAAADSDDPLRAGLDRLRAKKD